ncbi:MAG: alpha/beta hydrolase [Leptolyngbyaceae cyanobacterium MAG.088]|nr:alpha/beta hydrolase [Leptolyngbyaceae cyanobacterium MAG.088]
MRFRDNCPKSIRRILQASALSLLSGIIVSLPVRAADEVYLDYGPFGRVIPASSIETFAEDGTIADELAPVINAIPPERQQDFQRVLNTPLNFLSSGIPEQVGDPFILSQWLYSPMGESVLARVGRLIQTEGRQNGQQAIRAAIILAAADPDGLSPINLLRHYPTGGVRLDLQQILVLANVAKTNLEATEQLITIATQQSKAAAAADPILDYSALPILGEFNRFNVVKQSLSLEDNQRNRTYPVNLYMPEDLSAIQGPVPVMVFSHGYGDTKDNPEAVTAARRLAANGFMVAMPEHVGSNKTYQNDLLVGLVHESFEAMEFVNRPLDIRFLLDTLEQKNSTDFQGRLQLDRVGLIGHSFGGYTVLATAGAIVDIDRLQRQCDLNADISPENVNVALALECRLLELEASSIQQLTDGSLADERVGHVFALAPVSNLFGESGMGNIQVPVAILGGATDVASPIALEQLVAFQGLTTPEKYFYLGENLSHTPAMTRVILSVTSPNSDVVEKINEAEELFSNLLVSLAIAHAQVYLLDNEFYRPYLTSAYVEAVSLEPTKLHLLRSIPNEL